VEGRDGVQGGLCAPAMEWMDSNGGRTGSTFWYLQAMHLMLM
jgi:hypothetical protein